jgi:hypothetical protein
MFSAAKVIMLLRIWISRASIFSSPISQAGQAAGILKLVHGDNVGTVFPAVRVVAVLRLLGYRNRHSGAELATDIHAPLRVGPERSHAHIHKVHSYTPSVSRGASTLHLGVDPLHHAW